MNKLYFKYNDKARGEYLFRVGIHDDIHFIPEKNEPIILMVNGKMPGDICIGDGRRSVYHLPVIKKMFENDSFIVKPTVMKGYRRLKDFVDQVERFIFEEQHSEDELYKLLQDASDYTDLPVVYEYEVIISEHKYNMLYSFVCKGREIISAIESSSYSYQLDCLSEDQKIFGKEIKEFQVLDVNSIYLPKYEEVVIHRTDNGKHCVYVGDGEHTIGELYPLDGIYFESCGVVAPWENEMLVKPELLFNREIRQIFSSYRAYSDPMDFYYMYNKKVQRYTDINIRQPCVNECIISLFNQIDELLRQVDNMTAITRKVLGTGGYEY